MTDGPPSANTSIEAPKRGSRQLVYVKRRPVDREFLPAALEIIETPPSPVGTWLITLICGFFIVAFLWAYIGTVDILAVAQGKIQPTGRVKTVQALETSRVLSIDVQNGSHVDAGDVLIRVDPREARADEAASTAELAAILAESFRRQSAIDAALLQMTSPPQIKWPDSIPEPIRINESQVLRAELAQLASQQDSLREQIRQKTAEQARLTAMVKNETDLIETLQKRVDMRAELIRQGAGSKANLLDSVEAVQRAKTELARDSGQLAEIEANLAVIKSDSQKVFKTFAAENAQKFTDAQRRAAELREKVVHAQVRAEMTTMRSPVAGVVQGLSVTTVGQVVTPSEELMRIVPDGVTLEVECYLPNREIGFVHVHQSATVKVESFPFTRFGSIRGEVIRVAHDAVPEPEARATEQDDSQLSHPERGRAQRVQNLVFPVTVRLDKLTMDVEGAHVPLQPGMTVVVEIKTGRRRLIDYVTSPLIQTGSEALKER